MQPLWSDVTYPSKRLSNITIARVKMKSGDDILCILRHVLVDQMERPDSRRNKQSCLHEFEDGDGAKYL